MIAPTTPSALNNQLRPHPRLITELPPPSQLDIEWSPVLTRNNERILKLGNLFVTSTSQPHSPNSKEASAEAPKKFSRFFGGGNTTKRRQRLVMVTSSGRIVIAAAGGEEKKAKMEISLLGNTTWRSYKDNKGLTVWSVDGVSAEPTLWWAPPCLLIVQKDKHLLFEDPKATPSDPDGSMYAAKEWLEMLDKARQCAFTGNFRSTYSQVNRRAILPSPNL